MSAVSKKLIPASTAFWMIGRLASSFSVQSAMPPKLMQPRQSRDTWVPVDPMRVNFIVPILVWSKARRTGFWRRAPPRDRVCRVTNPGGLRHVRDRASLGELAGQLAEGPRRLALQHAADRGARPRHLDHGEDHQHRDLLAEGLRQPWRGAGLPGGAADQPTGPAPAVPRGTPGAARS